ncbi:MAG: transketolase [Syntrophales bacterium]|nr:transketolase [Syntrophales bacterium]MDY0044130.1 transketolase [Syntrophales bacterium]
MNSHEHLESLARLVRHSILIATAEAGSGHPTSGLSATELMVGLLFGGAFRFDMGNVSHPNNDRLIFSKGHASPLFYALWLAAGALTREEILSYRKFGSPLEGHPMPVFPYAEVATGSLGQGLSIGVGMAINAKYLDRLPYKTYVLLGDSELSEGSQWEAIQIAAHYELDNLIGIVDVNRLGQRGETMYGHDTTAYQKRISSFGIHTIVIDGHSYSEILGAYEEAAGHKETPTVIIARTVKGKGISFFEDRHGWHGKAPGRDDLVKAVNEIGDVDFQVRGRISEPEDLHPQKPDVPEETGKIDYKKGTFLSTREAYGQALKRIYPRYPDILCMDAEVSNSTMAEIFKEAYPDRFFEMYIAEQNMVGTALGLSVRGKTPFVSTFAAFFTRAFDQIRMSRYSAANIKFVGSHAGVSIGQDGPSQMGLEDIAMFRTILDGVVLYPCDAVSTEKLVEEAARHEGIVYIRTTRGGTPIIYDADEEFPVGGCKILRKSEDDNATVVAAGVTVHEALAAYEELRGEGTAIRVIDLYSIKPLDRETLRRAALDTGAMITVEDHYAEGGLGEAVASVLAEEGIAVHFLAVRKPPMSGTPEELMEYEEISRRAIIRKIREVKAAKDCKGISKQIF